MSEKLMNWKLGKLLLARSTVSRLGGNTRWFALLKLYTIWVTLEIRETKDLILIKLGVSAMVRVPIEENEGEEGVLFKSKSTYKANNFLGKIVEG